MKNTKKITQRTILGENRNKYYYWVLGSIKNPAMVLLPGFTGTHNDLIKIAEGLKEKHFVIIPDLPGWGKSPRLSEKLTLGNYAIFLKSILDDLKISKVTFCGHCMGSILSIEFAYKYPHLVNQLILISTPFLEGTIGQALLTHLVDMSRHAPRDMRRLFFIWRSRIFVTPISFYIIKIKNTRKKLKLIKFFFKNQGQANEDSVEENLVSIIDFDYKKTKKIKAPIHLISGEKDLIITKNQMYKFNKMIPTATLDFIPNAGHLPPVETPQSLIKLILKYY